MGPGLRGGRGTRPADREGDDGIGGTAGMDGLGVVDREGVVGVIGPKDSDDDAEGTLRGASPARGGRPGIGAGDAVLDRGGDIIAAAATDEDESDKVSPPTPVSKLSRRNEKSRLLSRRSCL